MGMFSLDTDKDRAVREYSSTLNNYLNSAHGIDSNVRNRFDGYSDRYSVANMRKALDDAYGYARANINQNASQQLAQANAGVAERLASQGVSGASGVNQAMYRANSDGVGAQKITALASLLGQKAQAEQGLMEYGNSREMQVNQLAQAGDQQNLANLLSKYGLLGNAIGMKGQNVNNYSDTNWLDDVLAVANTGARIATGFMG